MKGAEYFVKLGILQEKTGQNNWQSVNENWYHTYNLISIRRKYGCAFNKVLKINFYIWKKNMFLTKYSKYKWTKIFYIMWLTKTLHAPFNGINSSPTFTGKTFFLVVSLKKNNAEKNIFTNNPSFLRHNWKMHKCA